MRPFLWAMCYYRLVYDDTKKTFSDRREKISGEIVQKLANSYNSLEPLFMDLVGKRIEEMLKDKDHNFIFVTPNKPLTDKKLVAMTESLGVRKFSEI
jgi:hypothetical protein